MLDLMYEMMDGSFTLCNGQELQRLTGQFHVFAAAAKLPLHSTTAVLCCAGALCVSLSENI
jgi:hypothetical protein